jgi:hypothetical protein
MNIPHEPTKPLLAKPAIKQTHTQRKLPNSFPGSCLPWSVQQSQPNQSRASFEAFVKKRIRSLRTRAVSAQAVNRLNLSRGCLKTGG